MGTPITDTSMGAHWALVHKDPDTDATQPVMKGESYWHEGRLFTITGGQCPGMAPDGKVYYKTRNDLFTEYTAVPNQFEMEWIKHD